MKPWVIAAAVAGLGLVIFGVATYFRHLSAGAARWGGIVGAFTGAIGGGVVGVLFGRSREKAFLGPLPPYSYAADQRKLRRSFLS